MKTIIKNPRITEKASNLTTGDVYVFDIVGSTNKVEVSKAVFEIYKVHPVRVNMLRIPKKRVVLRGKLSLRGGGKKAYVYLKKGDKIEFI